MLQARRLILYAVLGSTPMMGHALNAELNTAQRIRYGQIDSRTLSGAERYQQLDAALADSENVLAQFHAGATGDANAVHPLFDRCLALVYRHRPAEAVALAESLRDAGYVWPSYLYRDLAGAYLSLRQPEQAEHLYRLTLAESPDDFEAQVGLYYALLESEQLDTSLAYSTDLAQRLPHYRHRDGAINGEWWSAQILSDQALLYTGHLPEAAARLNARLQQSPHNGELLSAIASLQLARGWRRLGEQTLRRRLAMDPEEASLHAELAQLLLHDQRWAEASSHLEQAAALDPDSPRVSQAQTAFARAQKPELYYSSALGRSSNGNPLGNQDYRRELSWYSAPLADAWRLFARAGTAGGHLYAGKTDWQRADFGTEWRQANTTYSIGLRHQQERWGLAWHGHWQLNDYWQASMDAESLNADMALQAINAGIRAKRLATEWRWQANESRQLAASLQNSWFDDHNHRQQVSLSWFERWYSGPHLQWDSTLGAYASSNTLGAAAAYFNPARDSQVWLDSTLDHLLWRRYDTDLRQRLSVSVGRYYQNGFAASPTYSMEYQQRWNLGADLFLSYGAGRSLRSYDGAREARNFASVAITWRY